MTTNELLWYISRAGGLAAIVLLTIVLALGTWGPVRRSERRRSGRWLTGPVLTGLHRTLALGTVCFVAVHAVTATVETFVDISWPALVLPFSSGYRPLPVGLGTIAVDLALTVVATALLRTRLPRGWWRTVHRAAYALWPIAGLHALLLSGSEPAAVRYGIAACIGAGTFAIARRAMAARPTAAAAPARPQPQAPPARPAVAAAPPRPERLWSAS